MQLNFQHRKISNQMAYIPFHPAPKKERRNKMPQVFHYRISTKCKSAVWSWQLGFRRSIDTRVALVVSQVLFQVTMTEKM